MPRSQIIEDAGSVTAVVLEAFLGYKPGYKTLITQIFVDNDEHLDNDVVFGVTRHLIGEYRRGDGTPPDSHVTGPWYQLDYSFLIGTGEATLPTPPIK